MTLTALFISLCLTLCLTQSHSRTGEIIEIIFCSAYESICFNDEFTLLESSMNPVGLFVVVVAVVAEKVSK